MFTLFVFLCAGYCSDATQKPVLMRLEPAHASLLECEKAGGDFVEGYLGVRELPEGSFAHAICTPTKPPGKDA